MCCVVFVCVFWGVTCEWHSSPGLCARLAVCRLMGDVCSASEFAAFCPLMCAVTMETGALAGTTEMAMLWLGGLMRESGVLAGVPTGQLLTASFCHIQKEGESEKGCGRKEKVIPPETHICSTTKGTYRRLCLQSAEKQKATKTL